MSHGSRSSGGNVTATISGAVVGASTPADDFANPTTALLSYSLLGLYDGATWDRWRAIVPADAVASPTVGTAAATAFQQVFNGTTWDRRRSVAPGDAVVNPGTGSAAVTAFNEIWTGSVWIRPFADSSGRQFVRLDLDSPVVQSPQSTSTYAPTRHVDFGADPDVVVKASAGNVLSLTCHNLNAAARFAQLHNKATAPVNPDVPLYTFLVPAGAMLVIGTDFFAAAGAHFSTGIAFGFSTTEGTYTAGAAADQFTQILYK